MSVMNVRKLLLFWLLLLLQLISIWSQISEEDSAGCPSGVKKLYPSTGIWYKLTTPGFNTPQGYRDNEKCLWLIEAAKDTRLVLRIHDSHIEDRIFTTCDDLVSVYDGDSPKSVLIVSWCGSQNPMQISSSSNKMFITFFSDEQSHFKGVNMSFTQYPITSCGPNWMELGDNCYLLGNHKAPWIQAQKHCSYQKSNLALFQDTNDYTNVLATFGNSEKHPWIGITDSQEEGTFRAIDQTQDLWMQPFPTFEDHGMKDCIFLDLQDNTSNVVGVDDCRNLRPYLCKKKKDGSTAVFPAPETAVRDGFKEDIDSASFPYWIWLLVAVLILLILLCCSPFIHKKCCKSNRVSSATNSGTLLVDNIESTDQQGNKQIRVDITPRRGSRLLDTLPPLENKKQTWRAAVDVFSTANGFQPKSSQLQLQTQPQDTLPMNGVRQLGKPYPSPIDATDRFDRPHVKPLDSVSAISLDEFWKTGNKRVHVRPYQHPPPNNQM